MILILHAGGRRPRSRTGSGSTCRRACVSSPAAFRPATPLSSTPRWTTLPRTQSWTRRRYSLPSITSPAPTSSTWPPRSLSASPGATTKGSAPGSRYVCTAILHLPFFASFHHPGTYQQDLATKEFTRQSWRYHKGQRSWFQVSLSNCAPLCAEQTWPSALLFKVSLSPVPLHRCFPFLSNL